MRNSQCKRSFKKNELPSRTMCNNLQLDEIPQELKDLISLDVVFISRRIPFMKLLALPRGKRKGVHGCVESDANKKRRIKDGLVNSAIEIVLGFYPEPQELRYNETLNLSLFL